MTTSAPIAPPGACLGRRYSVSPEAGSTHGDSYCSIPVNESGWIKLLVSSRIGKMLCTSQYGMGHSRRTITNKSGRPTTRWTAPTGFQHCPASLDADLCTRLLELGLGRVGSLLVDLLEQRLRRALDQLLGLLQPQARDDLTDHLDDLDLLVARAVVHDVELVLLFFLLGRGSRGGRGCRSRGRSRRDVERLLELLDELGELQQGHLLEDVEQFVSAHLRHSLASFHTIR